MSASGAIIDQKPKGRSVARRPLLGRSRWLRVPRRRALPTTPVEIDATPVHEKEASGIPWRPLSFVVLVLVPFLLSVYYYGWVASDQYEAEARFVVRTIASGEAEESEEEGEGKSGGLINMSALTQDAYVVTSFIHSAEILRRMGESIDWGKVYSHPGIDRLSRFDPSDGAEPFLEYWKGKVTTFVDGPSGIDVVQVRPFDPNDARVIADAIVGESEILVNELSERARRDLVRRAAQEVNAAAARYTLSLAALNKYQNESGMLEPTASATAIGETLTGLLAKRLEVEGRMDVLEKGNNVNSPTYRQLALARTTLNRQIEEQQARLASSGSDETLSRALVDFSRLETDKLLAEKLYEAARKNLEAVQQAALRQSAYIAPFARPLVADTPRYPKRFVTPILIFIALLVLWATTLLAFATVEDHRS